MAVSRRKTLDQRPYIYIWYVFKKYHIRISLSLSLSMYGKKQPRLGRDYITPQKAIFSWYISGKYCKYRYHPLLTFEPEKCIDYIRYNMGVSKNRGTPKWMVYFMENPIKMDDLGGPPLFLETPIWGWLFSGPPSQGYHLWPTLYFPARRSS